MYYVYSTTARAMKLTKSLDIALLLLVRLALRPRLARSAALSAALDVPPSHVAKVVQTLARGGVLRTRRGKGGGIELAKPPSKILLSDVFTLMEGPLGLLACIRDKRICALTSTCRFRRKIIETQKAIIRIFQATTVADLIPR